MARPKEQTLYGLRACLAAAQHRPDDLLRAFHTADRRSEIGPLLSSLAQRRRPYREVDDAELRRVAGTPHHEGIALVCAPLCYADEPALPPPGPDTLWLALDGVTNPHNQGAILRSAAWFGVGAVLQGGVAPGPLNAAAIRVAQGGAEVVRSVACPELAGTLARLRARGVQVLGADQRAERSAFDPRTFQGPVCLVMGNEARGLSPAVRRACTATVGIPGSGAVESLNVAVAAGVLMASARR